MSGGRTMYGKQHVSFDDYSSMGIASPAPQPTADGMVKAVLSPVRCKSILEEMTMREVIEVLDRFEPDTPFVVLRDALRSHFGGDSLSEGRATDLVADYLYEKQFRR